MKSEKRWNNWESRILCTIDGREEKLRGQYQHNISNVANVVLVIQNIGSIIHVYSIGDG